MPYQLIDICVFLLCCTRQSTSATLSISESIAEIDEDHLSVSDCPAVSKKYGVPEIIPLTHLERDREYVHDGSSSDFGVAATSSQNTTATTSKDTLKAMAPDKKIDVDAKWMNPSPSPTNTTLSPKQEPKLDSDSGEVSQALLEIDTNIKDGSQLEPKLLNKKKRSGNQGNTPTVDILKLDDMENEISKELDLDADVPTSDVAQSTQLKKTK